MGQAHIVISDRIESPMTDLADFAEEDFDVEAWINRACSAHATSEQEPLERGLAELEMRLQLTAEEIEASLHDLSVQAMRRIPIAVQEIYRLLGEIQGMQDQLKGLEAGVHRDASMAVESVQQLTKLDRVKRNMESACSTLKEATELSGLFVKVRGGEASEGDAWLFMVTMRIPCVFLTSGRGGLHGRRSATGG